MGGTYYNEFDPFAAEWLRKLMKAGLIPQGEVDERDIRKVQPADLVGFTRCHFFAGIGGWELALQLAGWPEDRQVWTGSCPCQPFSCAGENKGHADDRHLWPAWFGLIRELFPIPIFAEQTENAIAHGWLDGVCADLEGEGYAVGACVLGAHSVGSPHIRQRLYWVANSQRSNAGLRKPRIEGQKGGRGVGFADDGKACRMADLHSNGRTEAKECSIETGGDGTVRTAFGLDNPIEPRLEGLAGNGHGSGRAVAIGSASPAGFWSNFHLVQCRDGKVRRAPSGIHLLASRIPNRMGRLRGFGNSIVPQVAAEFIKAFLESESCNSPNR